MVSYVGLSELNLPAPEERHARTVVQRHMLRIETLADDIIDARVRIRRMRKAGGTSRYEVSIALLTNEGARYSTSSSWTLATALHNAFESIENQLLSRKETHRHEGGHSQVWRYPNPVI